MSAVGGPGSCSVTSISTSFGEQRLQLGDQVVGLEAGQQAAVADDAHLARDHVDLVAARGASSG